MKRIIMMELERYKQLLLDLKQQADNYQELFDKKEHSSISNEELANWHLQTMTLINNVGIDINSAEHSSFKTFKNYVDTESQNPFTIAVQLKRRMKGVLLDFYWIFIKLYKLLYGNTKYKGYLPKIIK